MGPLVASVVGLDNLVQYGRVPLSHGQAKPGLAPAHNAPADITCSQPGSTTVPTSYTPSQIATAYNFNQLYANGNLGEGQTVGLLELDGFSLNDIALYASCFGGKNTAIQTIPIDGYNGATGAKCRTANSKTGGGMGIRPRLAASAGSL